MDLTQNGGLGKITGTNWDSANQILRLTIQGSKGASQMKFQGEFYESSVKLPESVQEVYDSFGVSKPTELTGRELECYYMGNFLAAIKPI